MDILNPERGTSNDICCCKDLCEWSEPGIRLPKESRFEGEDVNTRRVGQDVILSPRQTSWDDFCSRLTVLPWDEEAARQYG